MEYSGTLSGVKHKNIIMHVHEIDRFKNRRIFYGFDVYDEFKSWYRTNCYNQHKYHKSLSCFEIIKEGFQKFRLDIDNKVKMDRNDIIRLVQSVSMFFNEIKIKARIIACSNVNNSGDIVGIGYHIIADVFFASSKDVHAAVCKYTDSYGAEWKDCIDMCVYKTNQAFRMVGSTKQLKSEYKRAMFIYIDEVLVVPKECDVILLTMCSWPYNYHNNGIKIHTFSNIPQRYASPHTSHSASLHTSIDVNSIIEHLNQSIHGAKFRLRKRKGNLLILDSYSPYYCLTCQRSHASENPYVLISNKTYKFFCRREVKR